MLAVISSEGDLFFQFLKGNSNEASVAAFIYDLAAELDIAKEEWRSNHVLLMDNCPSHKTLTVT